MLDSLKNSPLKIGIILVILAVLNVVGWYLYLTWEEPLGESIDLPISTPITENLSPTETPEIGEGDSATVTPEIVITPTNAPVCGAPPTLTVLISGVASEGYFFGLADSVRVARVDFQKKQITVLAIPRDLWVDISPTSEYSVYNASGNVVTNSRLNQAYFFGTEGMQFSNGPGFGSGMLAAVIQENFGLRVDRYLAVNHYGFRYIIDAIGGIDVYFPQDVNIKWFNTPKLYLEAGLHHLNGKQAEQVVRTRIEIGDFGRIRNQTLVLKAVALKMLTPNGIKQIPDFVNRLSDFVLTDFSPSDISQMTCLLAMIDPKEDIVYQAIPEDLLVGAWVMDDFQGYQVYALTHDQEVISDLLAKFEVGEWLEE